ncbi:MAG: hypothetical protein Q8R63_04155 [Ramlibacter sp.]|nr:hypothetical protein [Ramlibacter sp.]
MTTRIRNHIAAAFLLMPVAATLMALPATAQAQRAAPQLESFAVEADNGLASGSELSFRVEGAPRAQVTLRIRGVQRLIVLKETDRGVYTGSYTIRRADRINEESAIRASLRVRNVTTSTVFNFPANIDRPVAVRPPRGEPRPPVVVAPALRIERFAVTPVNRLEPGAELMFTLNAVPGARAEFDIPGVVQNVPMREVRPGVYEGSYTIRRMDNFAPSRPVVATLRIGDRVVTQALTQALIADARPPVIRHTAPRDGEAVLGRGAAITGTFDDAGGVGVDPRSVRIVVSGRNVTAQSVITPQSFTYRADLPPGRHSVEVTASDLGGNTVRRAWDFEVVARMAPTVLPLQVTNHANNAQIPAGATLIQGRTLPGATVDVKVMASASVVGLGINQELLSQRVQADGNGNFSFSFSPQFPLPGTRYDVQMTSTRGNLRTESTLVLFQRQG